MTTTPEPWEQQLRDAANTIPDTDGMEAIRHALADHITGLYEALGWPADLDPDDALSRAAALRDEHEQLRIRAEKHRIRLVAAEDDLLCIRADLSHAGYRLGERVTPAVETILRELRQARAYAQHAVWEATEVNRRLNARCAALWDLLKRQTRISRVWRRRATTAIADAVEQTARDMQRAGQLRHERDEARAEVERLRDALSEPAAEPTIRTTEED